MTDTIRRTSVRRNRTAAPPRPTLSKLEIAQTFLERFPTAEAVLRQFYLDREKERAAEVLYKFQQQMINDPVYALQWGDAAINAAAMSQVIVRVEQMLAGGTSMARVSDVLAEGESRHQTSHSSSPMANLTEEALRAAYREMRTKVADYNEMFEQSVATVYAESEGW